MSGPRARARQDVRLDGGAYAPLGRVRVYQGMEALWPRTRRLIELSNDSDDSRGDVA